MAKTNPKEDEGLSFSLTRPGLLGDMLGRPVRGFVTGLMLLAGLILLAACANLGGLFAARAADRSKEVALRLALGSSRKRILRQLLTEATLVSLVGGVLGLAGSIAVLRWLSAWQPLPNVPINVAVNPDGRTYAVALVLALVSGFLCGMVPVRQVLRTDPYQVIKTGEVGVAGLRRLSPRDVLLAAQIAICAVLVTASLVAVRGLVRSLHSNLGFTPENAMLVVTELDKAGYSRDRVPVMQRRMLDVVEAIPGVTAAGYTDRVPLGLSWNNSIVFADTTTELKTANAAAEAFAYNVSPGYFKAAGTALLAGRYITWHDDKNAPRVAVINKEFARKLFGSTEKAIGSYYKANDGTRVQVVGVAEDGRYTSLTEDPRPAMFLPDSAVADERHLAGGSVEPRSTAAGGDAGRIAAQPERRAADDDHHLAERAGRLPLCRAHGDRVAGSDGWAWRGAGGYGHLRDGCILGEQTTAGVGDSHRPGRATKGSVAGGTGADLPVTRIWLGGGLAPGYSG